MVTIEPLRPDQTDDVAKVILDAYETDANSWPSGRLSDAYRDELKAVAERADQTEVLVALDEGRVIGNVTYVGDSSNPYAEFDDPEAGGLRMLAVSPSAQKGGVGRLLVEACLERARAQGRKRLLLHTAKWMTNAQRFYERLGFVRTPELDWTPVPEVPLIGYSYEIGS